MLPRLPPCLLLLFCAFMQPPVAAGPLAARRHNACHTIGGSMDYFWEDERAISAASYSIVDLLVLSVCTVGSYCVYTWRSAVEGMMALVACDAGA